MKPTIARLLAILATASLSGALVVPASASTPHEISGTDDTGRQDENAGGMAEPPMRLAQADPAKTRKEVRVITRGDGMPPLPDIDAMVSSAMSEAFADGFGARSGRVIKDAPYSAEAVSERIQALADGNSIAKTSSQAVYRDGAGRTRKETRNDKGEVKSVELHDAVAGVRYLLNPANRTVSRLGSRMMEMRLPEPPGAKLAGDAAKTRITEMSGPGHQIFIKRMEQPDGDGAKEVRKEIKVHVAGDGHGADMGMPDGGQIHKAITEALAGTPMMSSLQDLKWAAKSTTKDLGNRDFDGVRAEGKQSSYTIPAGEIGNRNPIAVTTESWYSPELQITVYQKRSDPRSGDVIYRLANLKRGEPPAALFAVPGDYTLKDSSKEKPKVDK